MASPKKCTLDDLLLLATGTPERTLLDDVALHFYTGLRGLTQLQASIDCPLQKLWLCADGLRLLFDANAIWIRDDSDTSFNSSSDSVREVASLTSSEKDLLRSFLWQQTPIPMAETTQCGAATWVRLSQGGTLGDLLPELLNSNLKKTESVLWLSVDAPLQTWTLALLLPGESSAGPREAVKMCTWLMGSAQGVRCNALIAGFRRLAMPFGASAIQHNKYWWPKREKIDKKLRGLSVRDFQEKYRAEFWAMHGVLRVLHNKFTRLITETLQLGNNSVRIIFSYRVPEEDSIRFLPTDKQAEEFVKSTKDIGEFLDFCYFPYPQDKALSGWVLSTGMWDYTENFSQDGRWENWLATDDQGVIQLQLQRVKKFVQRNSTLPHVYLVPILMAPGMQDDEYGLHSILMVSISVAAPLPVAARREIFDLAVVMRPALDIALDAQNNSVPGDPPPQPSMTKPQWFSYAIGILGTLVGIAGFAIHELVPVIRPPLQPPVQVTLGVNPIPMSSMTILAGQENYYGRYNLQVHEATFPTGRKALDAVLAGDAQFATVAETPLVMAALADQKLAVVATMSESKEEMKLIVNSDRIHSISDLAGATLATARGTNADYFMYEFLSKHGIRLNQVKTKNLSPSEMVDALANGSISGYFVWQPFIYKGTQLKNIHTMTYSGSDFYTMTFNIVTSRKFATEHRDQVKSFLKALEDAQQEIQRDPIEGEQAVAAKTGIDMDTLNSIWSTYDFRLHLDDSLVKDMEDQRPWAITAGGYNPRPGEASPNFHDLLAPDALKEIDEKAVTLH
jgi:NitT/TauT family transport system substrate-binding protein